MRRMNVDLPQPAQEMKSVYMLCVGEMVAPRLHAVQHA